MAYSYQLNTTNFVIKIEGVLISPVEKTIVITVSKLNLSSYDVERLIVQVQGDDFLAMASQSPQQGNGMYGAIKQAAWSYLLSSEADMAQLVLGRQLEVDETLPPMTEVE